MVKLEVMDNGAIYVDNTRITNRSTKPWGGATIQFSANVEPGDVVTVLTANGFDIGKIDPDYAQQQGVILNH